MDQNEISIFPLGEDNITYAKYFVGKSYLKMLSTKLVVVTNITFEPGCRNNWHIHNAQGGGGQILLVTVGKVFIRSSGNRQENFILVMFSIFLQVLNIGMVV